MFEATHLKTLDETGEPIQSTYFAYQIWDRFKDSHKEEWVCCPICKKKVTPVKPHSRANNVFVTSHFRNLSGQSCISGESDEHKNAKILLSNLIENKQIRLKIKNSYVPFNEFEFKSVSRIPFRWEQTREKRRSDVLFEFKNWHNVLGQGINFEIQDYEIKPEEEIKRETDWIQNGYSLTWIPLNSFKDESLSSNDLEINLVWSIEYLKSMRRLKEELSDLFYDIKRSMTKYEDRRNKTCRTCVHGSIDKNNQNMIACWANTVFDKHGLKGTKRHPTKHEPLDTCFQYKNKVEE